MMRIPGSWPLVIMYHGIVPRLRDRRNVDLGVVYQDDFERHLRELKRRFDIVHPEGYADLLERGRTPSPRSALITLDDGFQNLLDHALPVAEALQVPLLAFVCSGHLDGGSWLWFARAAAARITHQESLADLKKRLKRMPLIEIMEELRRAGLPEHWRDRELCRLLFDGASSTQLARACARGYLVLGGHTVNHPNMQGESAELCRREIVDNRRQLEEIAGRPVRLFAYPSGDVDDRVARQVSEAGFSGAFTINPPRRTIPANLTRFYLPRTGIYNPGNVAFWLKCAGVDTLRWKLGLLN